MKILNRNHLKIIGILSMLIDHIGVCFFPEITMLRILGRIAFPLFAFFIAEGFYYTKNKYKYLMTLFVFAVVSIYPYYLISANLYQLNTLFTFVFSIMIMILIDNIKKTENYKKFLYALLLTFLLAILVVLSMLGMIEYGMIGVLIPISLWMCKQNRLKQYLVITIALLIQYLEILTFNNFSFSIQIFSLLAVPVLLLYNGKKGNYNMKYFFYIFYPLHLLVIFLVKLI